MGNPGYPGFPRRTTQGAYATLQGPTRVYLFHHVHVLSPFRSILESHWDQLMTETDECSVEHFLTQDYLGMAATQSRILAAEFTPGRFCEKATQMRILHAFDMIITGIFVLFRGVFLGCYPLGLRNREGRTARHFCGRS
jgi:hypothetical protein